ncbi:glycosyltransferase involved in cell wall biosynthesis [Pseudomonas sp. BS3782 TE3695]|uniref:glycosyltransferase family 2 protein n=1 Tax=Pseudomonas sp. BS3782 TE3695 TaxID=3349323 RepID=UPI003D22F1EB
MLTLVIPVYKNEGSLPDLLIAIDGLNSKLAGNFEAVFVIDGSPDRCYEILRDQLPKQRFESQLVLLSRNFGSFAAIRVGLETGRGERFAVMAADLQEPPELVLEMNTQLLTEQYDVVLGVREARDDPFMSRIASKTFWNLYRRYIVPEIPEGGVDVFGCNKAFRDTLLTLDERHSSLIAQIFWLGFRRKTISYSRLKREHGTSAWTFSKKVNYMMDSIFAFTDLPIRLLTRLGGVTTVLAAGFGIAVTIARLLGLITVSGYAMTINVIVFLGAANLLGLGIVGSYAWRTYENTKARPLAIPMRTENFNHEK